MEVMVCGDGQCDSPGHTAKNLCYLLMELGSDYILEVEVCDKRHFGLASTNMERQALQNALQRLCASINIVEVVTDASTSIKKMIGKMQLTVLLLLSTVDLTRCKTLEKGMSERSERVSFPKSCNS